MDPRRGLKLPGRALFCSRGWLTEDIIESAFLNAALKVLSITKAFSLERNEGAMQVLMGVAQNT